MYTKSTNIFKIINSNTTYKNLQSHLTEKKNLLLSTRGLLVLDVKVRIPQNKPYCG